MDMDGMSAEEYRIYLEGVRDGVTAFAHWKDGMQYVGTCGTTLKEALAKADEGKLYGQREKS